MLVAVVAAHAETIEVLRQAIGRLEARVAELERQLGAELGELRQAVVSRLPPSANARRQSATSARRPATSGRMASAAPRVPGWRCRRTATAWSTTGPSAERAAAPSWARRPPAPTPPPGHRPAEDRPEVTEHRALPAAAPGRDTTAAFPATARAPTSYGPGVRAGVAYLSAASTSRRAGWRRHGRPVRPFDQHWCRRLDLRRGGPAPAGPSPRWVALLRSLPVLHSDETTDRIGTTNCWMHVVSTGLYTLIHASATRGSDAIDEAGCCGATGEWWSAKHGIWGAHILRPGRGCPHHHPDRLGGWAGRRARGDQRGLRRRPSPRPQGRGAGAAARRRRPLQRHCRRRLRRQPPQAGLPPASLVQPRQRLRHPPRLNPALHARPRRAHHGAERFAHLRSYLSTNRKNGVAAIAPSPVASRHHRRGRDAGCAHPSPHWHALWRDVPTARSSKRGDDPDDRRA